MGRLTLNVLFPWAVRAEALRAGCRDQIAASSARDSVETAPGYENVEGQSAHRGRGVELLGYRDE